MSLFRSPSPLMGEGRGEGANARRFPLTFTWRIIMRQVLRERSYTFPRGILSHIRLSEPTNAIGRGDQQGTCLKALLFCALLVLPSLPAFASHFDWDKDRQALLLGADGTRQAMGRLTALALEVEKIGALKDLVDEGTVRANDAASAAQLLNGRAQRSRNRMEAVLKGKEGWKAPAESLELQSTKTAEVRQRWEKAKEKIDPYKNVLEGGSSSDPSVSRRIEAAKSLLHDALGRLHEADDLLKTCEAAIETMKTAKESLQEKSRRAEPLAAEIGKIAGKIANDASGIQFDSGETKARIDALGVEPQSVQRTKAWEKVSGLADAGSDLFSASQALSNRTDDFSRIEETFQKLVVQFEDSDKAVDKNLPDAKDRLDAIDEIISHIRLP